LSLVSEDRELDINNSFHCSRRYKGCSKRFSRCRYL